MAVKFEQVPIQARLVLPLAPLTQLGAHKQQLLAGLREHVPEHEAKIGEFLPVVSRHLIEQRTLAVYDLVMRKGENEILVEGVDHPERQRVLMKVAMDGVLFHIEQGI